jgi:hypothetical protein
VAFLVVLIIVAFVSFCLFKQQESPRAHNSLTPTPSFSSPTPVTNNFRISFPFSRTDVDATKQGESVETSVEINGFSSDSPTSFSIDDGISGIQGVFSEQTVNHAKLTLKISDSTPTGNYNVIITATNGNLTDKAGLTVPVLASHVTVSGTVSHPPLNPLNHNPLPNAGLKFTNTQTNEEFTTGVSGDTYLIVLPNNYSYTVLIQDSSGSYYEGFPISVKAPVGSTSVTQTIDYLQ